MHLLFVLFTEMFKFKNDICFLLTRTISLLLYEYITRTVCIRLSIIILIRVFESD